MLTEQNSETAVQNNETEAAVTQEQPGAAPQAATQDPVAPQADTDQPITATGSTPSKPSMFDIVKGIIGGKKQEPQKENPAAAPAAAPSAEAQPSAAQQKPAAAEQAKPDEVPSEIAKHPAYVEMQDRLAAVERPAQAWETMNTYLRENGVDGQSVKTALELAVLANNDPAAFYERVTAIADEYAVIAGKKLPADLQKRVDDGEMTEDAALLLAEANLRARRAEAKAARSEQTVELTVAEQRREENKNTVSRWFATKNDPDMGLKQEALVSEFVYLKSVEPADKEITPARVVELLNKAHENVTRRMTAAVQRRPVVPAPQNNGASRPAMPSAGNVDPMLSKVKQVLQRHGGGA